MLSAATCQVVKSLVSAETWVRFTPFLATKASRSVRGRYGVGVGLLAQKQPEGRLTAGRHSRPKMIVTFWRIFFELKLKGLYNFILEFKVRKNFRFEVLL